MNWKISHSLKQDKHEVKEERELRKSTLNIIPVTGWWDSARNSACEPFCLMDAIQGMGGGITNLLFYGIMLTLFKLGCPLLTPFASTSTEVWGHLNLSYIVELTWNSGPRIGGFCPYTIHIPLYIHSIENESSNPAEASLLGRHATINPTTSSSAI